MFKKLKEQVGSLESPKKEESPQSSRRRSSTQALPKIRSSQRLGVTKSDSNSSFTSITEADVLSGQVSQDDLLSAFMQRTNQLKKMEIKLSDYSQALKESNKERDKLANVLEKQQDMAMKRMSELEEIYSEGKTNMEKTIAKLEKKNSDHAETIEMLRTENKRLRTSVEKFVKDKNDFEKKRDEFFEKRDNTEELNDLQMQELAKIKHMLIMREKDCEKYRLDLDQKVAELLQSQDTNERMESSLRETTDSLNANVEELESQIALNEKNSIELDECRKTISDMKSEITDLKKEVCTLSTDFKTANAKLFAAESTNVQLLEKYDGLKHSSESLISKSNMELDERQATIDHLKQKISLLENRVTTDKLPESEQVQALLQERSSLEQKLEESHLQLNNIKSTWSVKINQLEEQVSHLNKKIAEDQEELNGLNDKLSQFKLSKDKETAGFNATISELQVEIEKSEVTVENYLQQITQLEAKLIEQSTLCDLEKEKTVSTHKRELEIAVEKQEELSSQIKTLSKSLQHSIEEKEHLRAKVLQFETDSSNSKQRFQELQNSYEDTQSLSESLQKENGALSETVVEKNSQLKIIEEKLVASDGKIHELDKKVADLIKIDDEKSAQMQTYLTELNSKNEEVRRYKESMTDNASVSKELEQKIQTLESTVQSREQELIDCKTEIATLKNSQAEETEEVASLKAERNKADELLAERERLIKVQQQRLNDLKKALNKELNKKSASGRSENQRTASPRRDNGVNGFSSNHTSALTEIFPDVSMSVNAADDSSAEQKELNIAYLKHVLLTFLGSSRSEALQLVKALATLLNFNRDEEKFLKDTLEYRSSWFGSKPSKKVGPNTSRK